MQGIALEAFLWGWALQDATSKVVPGMGNARSCVRSCSLSPAMQGLPLEIFSGDEQCKV
jgi:hypothetical protein